jgi:hypothetical protein
LCGGAAKSRAPRRAARGPNAKVACEPTQAAHRTFTVAAFADNWAGKGGKVMSRFIFFAALGLALGMAGPLDAKVCRPGHHRHCIHARAAAAAPRGGNYSVGPRWGYRRGYWVRH